MSKKIKKELNLKELPLDILIIILSYMSAKEFFVFIHYFINITYIYYVSGKQCGDPFDLQWKSNISNMSKMNRSQSSRILDIYKSKIDDLKKRIILGTFELNFEYPYYSIYEKRINKMFYHDNTPTKSYPLYCSLCIDSFQKYYRSKEDRNICMKCEIYNKTGKILSYSKDYYKQLKQNK